MATQGPQVSQFLPVSSFIARICACSYSRLCLSSRRSGDRTVDVHVVLGGCTEYGHGRVSPASKRVVCTYNILVAVKVEDLLHSLKNGGICLIYLFFCTNAQGAQTFEVVASVGEYGQAEGNKQAKVGKYIRIMWNLARKYLRTIQMTSVYASEWE